MRVSILVSKLELEPLS